MAFSLKAYWLLPVDGDSSLRARSKRLAVTVTDCSCLLPRANWALLVSPALTCTSTLLKLLALAALTV